MMTVHDFVAGLTRSGKSAAEIKTTVDATYGDKALGLTLIYYIIKKVKAGKTIDDHWQLSPKKTKRTADIIAAVAANVKEDRRVNCRDLSL
jgi:hypothetical protein